MNTMSRMTATMEMAQLQWRHVHGSLQVDGDCLRVMLHPQTQRDIEWACRWRETGLVPAEVGLQTESLN